MQKLEPAKLSCHTVGWRYSHSPRRKLPNLDSSWSWDSYAWNKPLFEWYIHPIIAPPSQLMSIWSETVSRKGGKDQAIASSQSRPSASSLREEQQNMGKLDARRRGFFVPSLYSLKRVSYPIWLPHTTAISDGFLIVFVFVGVIIQIWQ